MPTITDAEATGPEKEALRRNAFSPLLHAVRRSNRHAIP